MVILFPYFGTSTPTKQSGSDGISGQMLLICDETVVLPHIRNFNISRCLETCQCDSYL